MRIRYSIEAHNDLVDIIAYGTEKFGPAQASKYAAQIRNAIELIGLNPEMARRRTELKRPVRIHTAGSHMVVLGRHDRHRAHFISRPEPARSLLTASSALAGFRL